MTFRIAALSPGDQPSHARALSPGDQPSHARGEPLQARDQGRSATPAAPGDSPSGAEPAPGSPLPAIIDLSPRPLGAVHRSDAHYPAAATAAQILEAARQAPATLLSAQAAPSAARVFALLADDPA